MNTKNQIMEKKELIKKAKEFQDSYSGNIKLWNLSRAGIAEIMANFVLSLESQFQSEQKHETVDSLINFEKLIDKFFAQTPPKEIERILSKYDKMKFDGVSIKEYLTQSHTEVGKNAEEIKHEINQIICRYVQDNDYKTITATDDLFNLFVNHASQFQKDVSAECIKSAEEILNIWVIIFNDYELGTKSLLTLKEAVLKAMEDYASQFQKGVSDEEIENGVTALATIYAIKSVGDWSIGYITGAKWMRDKLNK